MRLRTGNKRRKHALKNPFPRVAKLQARGARKRAQRKKRNRCRRHR